MIGNAQRYARPPVPSAASSDEVRLVSHVGGLAAANADEDALVEPVEVRRGGLDLGGGAKRVLAGGDVLAAAQTGEHLGRAVAHSPRLDIEQISPRWSGSPTVASRR